MFFLNFVDHCLELVRFQPFVSVCICRLYCLVGYLFAAFRHYHSAVTDLSGDPSPDHEPGPWSAVGLVHSAAT